MTPASCAAAAALGLLLGGLVMAGVLLQAASRGRTGIPGPPTGIATELPDWEGFAFPEGVRCYVWRQQSASCIYIPQGPAPPRRGETDAR